MASYESLDSSDDEVVVLRSSGGSTVGIGHCDDQSENHAELDNAAATTTSVGEILYEAGMCCEVFHNENQRRGRQPETAHFALVTFEDAWSWEGFPEEPKIPLGVDVQSPILQKVLQGVFKDYPDVRGDTKKAVKRLGGSPSILFHCWDKLLETLRWTKEPTIKEHISLLVNLFKPEFKDAFKIKKECKQHLEIPWKDLWTVFPRGSLVYCQHHMMEETIMKVNNFLYDFIEENGMSQPCWRVEGTMVAFNGRDFGQFKTHAVIPDNGTMDFANSPVVPLNFHPDRKAIEKRLEQRGRQLQDISKQPVWDYSGKPEGIYREQPDIFRENVYERIIIHPGAVPNTVKGQTWSAKFRHLDPLDGEKKLGERTSLTDEELMTTVPDIPVYMLKSQKQDIVFIKDIKYPDWDTKTIANFVLPSDTKGILEDLVSAHAASDCTYEGMMCGTGSGVVIALRGPSGSGKSSLVHALAQANHKAVLEFTLSNLEDYTFENKLQDLFELGASMQMPVLLNDICRWLKIAKEENWKGHMILTLQRLIDQNRGLVFLTTTTSISELPPALASRIDLCVEMPKVNKAASRKQLWKGHLLRIQEDKKRISSDDIERLSEKKLSGKEITSIIKLAQLKAKNDKREPGVLSMAHLEDIIKIMGKDTANSEGRRESITSDEASNFDFGTLDIPKEDETEQTGSKNVEQEGLPKKEVPKTASSWGDWGAFGTVLETKKDTNEEGDKAVVEKDSISKPLPEDDWGMWGFGTKKVKEVAKTTTAFEYQAEKKEASDAEEKITECEDKGVPGKETVTTPLPTDDWTDWGNFGSKKGKKVKKTATTPLSEDGWADWANFGSKKGKKAKRTAQIDVEDQLNETKSAGAEKDSANEVPVENNGAAPLPEDEWGSFGKKSRTKKSKKMVLDDNKAEAQEEAKEPNNAKEITPEGNTVQDIMKCETQQVAPAITELDNLDIWDFKPRPKKAKKAKQAAQAATNAQDPAAQTVAEPSVADNANEHSAQETPSPTVPNQTITTTEDPTAMNQALKDLAAELEAKAKQLRATDYRKGADRILKNVKGGVVTMRNRIREVEAKGKQEEDEGGAKAGTTQYLLLSGVL